MSSGPKTVSQVAKHWTVNNDQRMEEEVLAQISIIRISNGSTGSPETLAIDPQRLNSCQCPMDSEIANNIITP